MAGKIALHKVALLYVVCSLQIFTTKAQTDSLQGVTLEAVHIVENRFSLFQQNNFSQNLNQTEIDRAGHYDLGEALFDLSVVDIGTFGGAGGAANISIRGTAPDHTVVMWNGFNINSITLGQADASAIPTIAADNVQIVYGGSSTLFGSGSLGGAILLDNQVDWNNRTKLNYQFKGGSFGNFKNDLGIQLGNKKIQYHLKASHHVAENDFTYINNYKVGFPRQEQEHNTLNNITVVQNLFGKIKDKNFIESGLWIQKKRKEIPETMTSFGQSNQLQTDFTTKGFLRYRRVFKNGIFEHGSAYFFDQLHFTDKNHANDEQFLIDSDIKAYRVLNRMNYRHHFNPIFKANIGGEFNILRVKSANLSGIPVERLGSVFLDLSADYEFITLNASARQEIDPLYRIAPIFSSSINLKIIEEHLLFMFSVAQKFRRPDFNERYWIGDRTQGNLDLVNEKGWGIDAGLKGQVKHNRDRGGFNWMLNGYFTSLNEGIIWQPIEGAWSPTNINNIKTYGAEIQFAHTYQHTNKWTFQSTALYHNNATVNWETKNSLSYRPRHTLKSNFGVNHQFFESGINWIVVSERFTDDSENNIFALDRYNLLHYSITGKYVVKGVELQLGLEIKNLLNTSYEVRRTFAQPGRAFFVNFRMNFNQINN